MSAVVSLVRDAAGNIIGSQRCGECFELLPVSDGLWKANFDGQWFEIKGIDHDEALRAAVETYEEIRGAPLW